jgi:hypothetical protein
MLKTSIKDKLVLRFSSACFELHFFHVIVTLVMYLTCTIIVLLKKTNCMTFNPTITLTLIYWFYIHSDQS